MAKDHSKPRLLCVASQPDYLTDLKKTLKSDFDVYTVSTIASAQNLLNKKSVHILLAAHPLEHENSIEFLKSTLDENSDLLGFLLDTQHVKFPKSEVINERFCGVLRPPFDAGILPALSNALFAQRHKSRSKDCSEKLDQHESKNTEAERLFNICYERLKGQQRAFYHLVQSDPDAILVIDRESLTVAEVNKSAEKLFQMSPKEIVNQEVKSFLSDETKASLLTTKNWLDKLFELTRDDVFEMTIVNAEGRDVQVQARMSIFPVFPPDFEAPVDEITVINLRDVSEQKRTEERLRSSQREYRNLLESIPQRIFYKDLNSNFIGINKSLAEDLGLSEKDVVGKTDFDLFPADLAILHQKDDQEIIEKRITTDRHEIHSIHGEERNVRTTKSPVFDENGQVVGVLGVSWDVLMKSGP